MGMDTHDSVMVDVDSFTDVAILDRASSATEAVTEAPLPVDRFTVDIELTNRCNTDCDFCPRDRTPHQGLMSEEVFALALERLVEFREQARSLFAGRVTMSFCGLGEQLLHRDGPEFVHRAAAAGFEPSMCSNGALLDVRRTIDLVEAGLHSIFVNSGEVGAAYDEVYGGLAFDRLYANLERFRAIAGDRCTVFIVLVDHRQDAAYVGQVEAWWRERGYRHFFHSPMLNRSGSLEVAGMDFTAMDEVARAEELFERLGGRPVCDAAVKFPFVGYDGTYYLCSSDWEKRVATGSVFDDPLMAGFGARLDVVTRRTPICVTCNHDPVNRVAGLLARADRGEITLEEVEEHAREALADSAAVHATVGRARERGAVPPAEARRRRTVGRHIPVRPA